MSDVIAETSKHMVKKLHIYDEPHLQVIRKVTQTKLKIRKVSGEQMRITANIIKRSVMQWKRRNLCNDFQFMGSVLKDAPLIGNSCSASSMNI